MCREHDSNHPWWQIEPDCVHIFYFFYFFWEKSCFFCRLSGHYFVILRVSRPSGAVPQAISNPPVQLSYYRRIVEEQLFTLFICVFIYFLSPVVEGIVCCRAALVFAVRRQRGYSILHLLIICKLPNSAQCQETHPFPPCLHGNLSRGWQKDDGVRIYSGIIMRQ